MAQLLQVIDFSYGVHMWHKRVAVVCMGSLNCIEMIGHVLFISCVESACCRFAHAAPHLPRDENCFEVSASMIGVHQRSSFGGLIDLPTDLADLDFEEIERFSSFNWLFELS